MTSEAPYPPNQTALLIVDPLQRLSEGGKLWPRAKEVAEGVGLLDHMRTPCSAKSPASGFGWPGAGLVGLSGSPTDPAHPRRAGERRERLNREARAAIGVEG
jgi:hypothetical protein